MKNKKLLSIILFTFLMITLYDVVWCWESIQFTSPTDKSEIWLKGGSTVTIDFKFTGGCDSIYRNQFWLFIDGYQADYWSCINYYNNNEYIWTVPASGTHTLLIKGEWYSESSGSFINTDTLTVYVDNDSPTIDIDYPHHNEWYKTRPLDICVTGRDSNSGLDKIEIYVDGYRKTTMYPGGHTYHNECYSFYYSNVNDYRIKAKAYDRAGNTRETPEILVHIDISSPEIYIDSPPDLTWHKGGSPIPIKVRGDDYHSGILEMGLIIRDHAANKRIDVPISPPGSTYQWMPWNGSGEIELMATIFDRADNYNEAVRHIYLDNEIPVSGGPPFVAGAVNGYCTTTTPEWGWPAATDVYGEIKEYRVFVREIGGPVIADWVSTGTTKRYSYTGIDGKSYECMYKAVDEAGNESAVLSGSINIDASVQKVTLPEYPLVYENGTLVFEWEEILDDFSGIDRYEIALTQTDQEPAENEILPVYSPDPNNGVWSYTFSGLSILNTYHAWVRGVDVLENKGDWTKTDPFPPFRLTGPENGLITNQLNHMITCEQVYKVYWKKVTGNPYDSGSFDTAPYNLQFPGEGQWEWWCEIGEFAGESEDPVISHITERFSLLIDTTPPNACSFIVTSTDGSIVYSASMPSNTRDVLLSGISISDSPGEGSSGIKGIYVWNGESDTPPQDAVFIQTEDIPDTGMPWELSGQDGFKEIHMMAEDCAGNRLSGEYVLTLDMTPPGEPVNITHSYIPGGIRFNWESALPNDDITRFAGICRIASGIEHEVDVIPSAEKNGTYDIAVPGMPNVPVSITIASFDNAGNSSGEVSYLAYTRAECGDLVLLGGGYNEQGDYVYTQWQLINGENADHHVLEFGEITGQDFSARGTIYPENGVIFTHDEYEGEKLIPHGMYHYRLVAFNTSGNPVYATPFTQKVPNNAPSLPVPLLPEDYAQGDVEFTYMPSEDEDRDTLVYTIYYGKGEEPSSCQKAPGGNVQGLEHGILYSWYIEVSDGYTSVRCENEQFTVDVEAPVIGTGQVKRPYTNQTEIDITIHDPVSGIASIHYQVIDSGTNELISEENLPLTEQGAGEYTGTLALAEGAYHMLLTACDRAGNRAQENINNLLVDYTSPELWDVVFDLLKSNGTTYCSMGYVPAHWKASDDFSGIKGIRYWITGNTEGVSGTGNYIPLSPGLSEFEYMLMMEGSGGVRYYIALSLEDRAGNLSGLHYQGPVLLDTTPPELSFNIAGNGLVSYGTGTFLSDILQLHTQTGTRDDESGVKETTYSLLNTNTGLSETGWTNWGGIRNSAPESGQTYRIECRVVNNAGIQTQARSIPFVYDDTPPCNCVIVSPGQPLRPGETCIFPVHAKEPDSLITEYRLALGASPGEKDISSLIPGNEDGWIIIRTFLQDTFVRVIMPETGNGTYYPILEVVNAAGLISSTAGDDIIIVDSMKNVIVNDQGPYTMFNDRLYGWWRYPGEEPVAGYSYRIIDKNNHIIVDWRNVEEPEAFVHGLDLESGNTYYFEAIARFPDGSQSDTGKSPGVIVDATPPLISRFNVPDYTTPAGIPFEWNGDDGESGISSVFIALGSDYFLTDITGGWVAVTGGNSFINADTGGHTLHLESGKRYYLTLRVINGAGLATESHSTGIIIDDSPPPVPVVIDQGGYINTEQHLKAHWIWSRPDPESGVSYEWSLLENPAELDKAVWQPGDVTRKIVLKDFIQEHGHTYYFAVRAVNGAGLTATGLSDGIMVDATAPYIPEVTLLDAVNLGNPEAEEIHYITSMENLGLWIQSTDPESPIDGYLYAWGTLDILDQVEKEESAGEQILIEGISMAEGDIIFFSGECTNEAMLVSGTGYSEGVMLDTGAPVITTVRGTVSGGDLYFDWDAVDSSSPVVSFEISLVPWKQKDTVPPLWTNVGLSRETVLSGVSYADGIYCLLVRAYNAVGTCSRRDGERDEWGISPPVVLDRGLPVVTDIICPDRYASTQFTVTVQAHDEIAGIHSYHYALGSITDPFEYSNGWVEVLNPGERIDLSFTTDGIPHNGRVFFIVRVRDNAGLWSGPEMGPEIRIDKTAPVVTSVTCDPYTTTSDQIINIRFKSDDPESGVTHYRMGVTFSKEGDWVVARQGRIEEFDGVLSGVLLAENGEYYVAVQTRNMAGLWSDTGYSNMTKIDTVKPVVEFLAGDETIVINTPPLVCDYTATEPCTIILMLTRADGSGEEYTVPYSGGQASFLFTENTPQVYTLSAHGTDPAGNTGDTRVLTIRVNAPPAVTLPEGFNTGMGAPVLFKATVTDPDGTPVLYEWNFGDGSPVSTEMTPEHSYSEKGLYTVTLIVTDNDNGTGSASMPVMIGNTTSGTIYVDEVWSGVHHIYGDVIVPPERKLTIMPGTRVIADGIYDETGFFHAIIIEGNLIADGGSEGIIFVSALGEPSGWRGIYIEGEAVCSNVAVYHAERGVSVMDNALVEIVNCTFEDNFTGIHVYNSQPVIRSTLFTHNLWYAIKEDAGGRPVVINCTFSGNRRDYYHRVFTSITIDQLNEIDGNAGNTQLPGDEE